MPLPWPCDSVACCSSMKAIWARLGGVSWRYRGIRSLRVNDVGASHILWFLRSEMCVSYGSPPLSKKKMRACDAVMFSRSKRCSVSYDTRALKRAPPCLEEKRSAFRSKGKNAPRLEAKLGKFPPSRRQMGTLGRPHSTNGAVGNCSRTCASPRKVFRPCGSQKLTLRNSKTLCCLLSNFCFGELRFNDFNLICLRPGYGLFCSYFSTILCDTMVIRRLHPYKDSSR